MPSAEEAARTPHPWAGLVTSGIGFNRLPAGLTFKTVETPQSERDEIFQDGEHRVATVRFLLAPPGNPATFQPNDAIAVAVYKARESQQVTGFRANLTLFFPVTITSWGFAITQNPNPSVLGNPNGENASLYEKDNIFNPNFTDSVEIEFPRGIKGPRGKYLNVGEKLYMIVFYTTTAAAPFASGAIIGSVGFNFQPSGRQQGAK